MKAQLTTSRTAARRAGALLATAASALFTPTAFGWSEAVVEDKFSGTKATVYSVASSNSLRLLPPFQGRNHGRFAVVVGESGAPTVVLSVEKGVIVCPLDYCDVAVKFGDLPPRNFVVKQDRTGGDYSSVVFSYPPAIVEQLTAAPDFIARVLVHGNGYQDLTFNNKTPLVAPTLKLVY